MNKRQGFTLVELLAVIVLLGVIALITIPAVTNTLSKQKDKLYFDQLNQLIMASKNWGTDNADELSELTGTCSDKNWYRLTLDDLKAGNENVTYLDSEFINPKTKENFTNEEISILAYKQDKTYLYCIKGCSENDTKYAEYKDIASKICCDGTDFKARINNCTPPIDILTKPVAILNTVDWSKSKKATVTFGDTGSYLVRSSIDVQTDVPAISCPSVDGEKTVCNGDNILENGTMLANVWYKVTSNPTVTFIGNGILESMVYNETNYKLGDNLEVDKIDNISPVITSFSGTIVSSTQYNTTQLKLTTVATDDDIEKNIIGSGIKDYKFYMGELTYNTSSLLGTSTNGIYNITNFNQTASDYKVEVCDNVGNCSNKTIDEVCSISNSGTCYNGIKTITTTCTPTGRKYSVTSTVGCTTTTTTSSSGSSCPTSCPNGYSVCGCGCCSNGSSSTTVTTKTTTSGSSDPCHCAQICNACTNLTGDSKTSCQTACASDSASCFRCCGSLTTCK